MVTGQSLDFPERAASLTNQGGPAMYEYPADQPPSSKNPQRAAAPARRRELPRCRLVLHHDHSLELMFVVRTVMELTRFCRAEATHKMWEAHHCGQSVLLITYRERAELIAELFAARGLNVTVEAN